MAIAVPKEVEEGEQRVVNEDTQEGWYSEIYPGERRVLPRHSQGAKLGFEVLLSPGLALPPTLRTMPTNRPDANRCRRPGTLGEADIVLKVRAPDMQLLSASTKSIALEGGTRSSASPKPDLLDRLAGRKATVLAMDAVPHQPRHKDGCPEFNGKHRWLPR